MMNIGDGLTLQSHTVEGKNTAGIFFLTNPSGNAHHSIAKNSKITKKYLKTRNKLQQNTENKVTYEYTKSKKQVVPRTSLKSTHSQTKTEGDVIFINNNSKVGDAQKGDKLDFIKRTRIPKVGKPNVNASSKKALPKHSDQSKSQVVFKPLNSSKNAGTKEIKVDTNFVTLTQDQLNTILNLVKTKQDIDLASVINKDDKEQKEKNMVKKTDSSVGIHVEPTSVPGLDLDNKKLVEEKQDSDKENGKTENIAKLLIKTDDFTEDAVKSKLTTAENDAEKEKSGTETKKTLTIYELSGTLGGYGSRDRDRSRLEERRKKWIEDLNEQVERKKQEKVLQRKYDKDDIKSSSANFQKNSVTELSGQNIVHQSVPNSANTFKHEQGLNSQPSSSINQLHESLPSAIRSSFFLGEALPREHAFSAKKKQAQQAWREELKKQIKEKVEKKTQAKNKKFEYDDDCWTRHFETMNPVSAKTNQDSWNAMGTTAVMPSSKPDASTQNQPQPSSRNPALNSNNLVGIYLGEHTTNSDANRVQTNYLRTMTSLLDPSQLDAKEIKKHKQLEHRRIIAEQVEEKRKLKEQERRAKKEEEEEEERRLIEERKQLKNQFEKEKCKQQLMEEKRDRQTQELFQQMKEAEAAALKDKFERRQQALKSHGHDTSRLERTHQHVLEKNMHSTHPVSPLPPSEQIPSLKLNIDDHHENSPRAQVYFHQRDNSPMTVLAGTNQPIKLEISVNQKSPANEQVAKGVQTDSFIVEKKVNRKKEALLDILSDSDNETQYLDLPYPSGKTKDQKRKNIPVDKEQETRNRHYDHYSRATMPVGEAERGRPSKRGSKPKWGVGAKEKNYVSNSDRYVNKRDREERENRLRQREEQLLADQARNDPDRHARTLKAKFDVTRSENVSIYARDNRRPQRGTERSVSPPVAHTNSNASNYGKGRRLRSSSPPVPALINHLRTERSFQLVQTTKHIQAQNRPETAISVTTDQAKYKSAKHTADSPVPDTDDYVQYRRSDVVLDPNQLSVSTEKELNHNNSEFSSTMREPLPQVDRNKDPLLNSEILKQKERQDRILKEICILRQGLLLKQREVASYPVALPQVGKNLPERSNDVSFT